MKYYQISKCRCCNSSEIKNIINFGKISLSTSFTSRLQNKEKHLPLHLVYCAKCLLVQLKHNFDFKNIYNNSYGYRSGINKTMNDHLKGIVEQAQKKTALKNGDIVLDIASNDGTLLKKYKKKNIIKIGIDPTIEKFKKFYPKNVIKSATFFNKETFFKLSKQKKAKIITSIAVFYDVSNPNIFVKNVKEILVKDGCWIIEQSYFPFLIKNNAYDSICHEHITYFMFHQINLILDRYDLEVFDIYTNEMNGGSIRLYISHKNSKYKIKTHKLQKIVSVEKKILKNPSIAFNKFKKNINQSKDSLVKLIKTLISKNKNIHIYGASTKGNVILQFCNINNKLIKYAADRNPDKIGKKTPGSNIHIISEKVSRNINPDYYLVMPWHFKKEFILRERKFLKKGGKFIFPLPKLKIL